MRTVLVQSPSVWRETVGVIRVVLHVAFWSAAIMLAPAIGSKRAFSQLAVDEVAYVTLDGEAQQTYQRTLDALATAEAARSTTGQWPAFTQIPGYQWRTMHDGLVTDYVGTAPGRTFVVAIVEPDPGMAADPLAVVDEQHHKLRDGTLLHVSVWINAKDLEKVASTPAFEDGWRRITQLGQTVTAPVVEQKQTLRIGVTLHPYYSWTANVIAGVAGAEVIPLLPSQLDADNFQPSPEDIAKIGTLDAIVINGIGHDDFIRDMIKASGNDKLAVIEINAQTPTVKSAHGDAPNSHTFISFTNAIQQTQYLNRQLDALRPADASKFDANTAKYVEQLRVLRDDEAKRMAGAKLERVVTVHDGYTYLLQEMGIGLAGVVQPAHGLTPSSKELGEMIELIQKEGIKVVLSEEDFPDKLLTALRDATGARVYIISHIAAGTYSPDEFVQVMTKNADTLVQALVVDPK